MTKTANDASQQVDLTDREDDASSESLNPGVRTAPLLAAPDRTRPPSSARLSSPRIHTSAPSATGQTSPPGDRTGRQLRIGMIAPPWVPVPPVTYGGTELVIDELARGLVRDGHDVVLFASGDSTCPVPRMSHHPSALGTTGALSDGITHAEAAYGALSGCDIIHDHTMIGPLVAGHAEFDGIPVVTTAHGLLTPEMIEHYRLIAGRVALITISDLQRSYIPAIPATTIHHGISIDAVPFGHGQGGFALFVGRMSADKGVHLAIDAARAAGMELKIAAKMWEPDEVAYFEQEIKPRLGPDVTYLGAVTTSQKCVLMGRAQVLINPICWPEPFGLVMIEALAAGTPVVALPNGAAPEIIDDGVTGYLSEDPDRLAGDMRSALKLDREDCRAAACRRFSATRMVTDHVSLYRDLIGSARRGAAGISVQLPALVRA